jgi:hypothetical protein
VRAELEVLSKRKTCTALAWMFCREDWVWMFLKVMARHKTKCPETHTIFLPTTVLQLFLGGIGPGLQLPLFKNAKMQKHCTTARN